MTNQLTQWQRDQAEMRAMLVRRSNDFDSLGTIDHERLIVVSMNAFRKLHCSRRPADPPIDKASLAECVMRSAQMGLEADGDRVYLVPYNDNTRKVAVVQMIVGPRGVIDCAYRSERVASISAHVVIEGDTFEYDIAGGVIEHKAGKRPIVQRERAEKITHAYARLKTVTLVGGKVPHVETRDLIMTRDDLEYYRQFSAARNSPSGPWVNHYQGMCMKTVLKHLLKHAPSAARSPMLEMALRENEHGVWVPPDKLEDDSPAALEPSRTQAAAASLRQQAAEIREPVPAGTGEAWEANNQRMAMKFDAQQPAQQAPQETAPSSPAAQPTLERNPSKAPQEPPRGAGDAWQPDEVEGGGQ